MNIELQHIKKSFPDSTPLKDVNAVIRDGDVIAVIGPSGTGKSTLLRCINLLDPPTAGRILVDGVCITDNKAAFEKTRRKMGMVFQSFHLFSHMTVIENVMLALRDLKHMKKQDAYDIAIEQLAKVGLGEKALKYPDELSGGQKQRVSIARTLAMDPELILLDEPTSALDPTMVREVENVICRLAGTGKTMMIVTHEMRLARAISNRVFYLDQGILYEEGTPEQIFDHPVRERTKVFVNHLKTFRYKFGTDDFDSTACRNGFRSFAENNDLGRSLREPLTALADRIADDFVPLHAAESLRCSLLTEYDPEKQLCRVICYISSCEKETVSALAGILQKNASAVTTEDITDPDYSYKISCVLTSVG